MARFRKQILSPGTYVTRSGPVDITSDDINAFATTAKGMLADKLSIPLPLEHQPKAKPWTSEDVLADSVRFNTGFVAGLDVDQNNSLWMDLDINGIPYKDDKGDVKMITDDRQIEHFVKNNVKYVSPELLPSFRDGRGKSWENVISHVALTTVPVWADQLPFGGDGTTMAPVAMSLVKNNGALKDGVCLSLADLWFTKTKYFSGIPKEDVPVRLSLPRVTPKGGVVVDGVFYRGGSPLRFAKGKDMADDKDKDKGKGKDDLDDILGGGDKGGDKGDADKGGNDDATQSPEDKSPGDLIKEASQAAKDIGGIEVSDAITDPTDWIKHFITAAKTHKSTKDQLQGGGDGTAAPDASTDKPKEEPQVVTMSTSPTQTEVEKRLLAVEGEWKKKLADSLADMDKKYKAQLSLMEKTNQTNAERAADAEYRTLVSTIDGWLKDGYVTPAKWNPIKEKLAAKKLSLVSGNDTEMNDVLARMKYTAEAINDGELKKGTAFPVTDDGEVVSRPEHAEWLSFGKAENMTPQRAKEVMAEVDKMMGRAPVKA